MWNKILYNQKAIYEEILNLFKAPTVRRVAVSAFVGKGAESYLPNPEGIILVCWPKAGGTNPHAVRKLLKRSVDVWFADRLHMKVYWAEGRGCVVTSANLSTNALGSGNLKEVGVLIGPDEMDIDALLASLNKRPVTDRELKKLDRLHARFVSLNQYRKESPTPTFKQWFRSPMRQNWKLGWADDYVKASQAANDKAREETGVAKPANWLNVRSSEHKEWEWILVFALAKDRPTEIAWMFAHHVVDVSPKDKDCYDKDYSCQAVQVWPLDHCPSCPFKVDRTFRKAFRAAVNDYGADRIRKAKTAQPPKELIDLTSSYI